MSKPLEQPNETKGYLNIKLIKINCNILGLTIFLLAITQK